MSIITLKAVSASKFNAQGLQAEIDKEANAVADDILMDFTLSTWTWKHNVKFEKLVSPVNPANIEILVGTDDPIFIFVDEGTRPHIIRPKVAKVLRFKGTYTAKTVPGVIVARPGGASGNDVFAKVVHHPGTKARGISKKIAKKWQGTMGKRLQQAIDRGIKKSGHGV